MGVEQQNLVTLRKLNFIQSFIILAVVSWSSMLRIHRKKNIGLRTEYWEKNTTKVLLSHPQYYTVWFNDPRTTFWSRSRIVPGLKRFLKWRGLISFGGKIFSRSLKKRTRTYHFRIFNGKVGIDQIPTLGICWFDYHNRNELAIIILKTPIFRIFLPHFRK